MNLQIVNSSHEVATNEFFGHSLTATVSLVTWLTLFSNWTLKFYFFSSVHPYGLGILSNMLRGPSQLSSSPWPRGARCVPPSPPTKCREVAPDEEPRPTRSSRSPSKLLRWENLRVQSSGNAVHMRLQATSRLRDNGQMTPSWDVRTEPWTQVHNYVARSRPARAHVERHPQFTDTARKNGATPCC
jgi:hypothetical protein